MAEYLLIDGYNVINAWREFAGLREENLEHARAILIGQVAEYAAFKGYQATIVFDAQEVATEASLTRQGTVDVVYTDEGETADSWIERKTYDLGRIHAKVFVVTSDYAEQLHVLGVGAYRVSSREFHEDFKKAKKAIQEKMKQPASGLNRNEVGNRLPMHVLEHFEKLRRK